MQPTDNIYRRQYFWVAAALLAILVPIFGSMLRVKHFDDNPVVLLLGFGFSMACQCVSNETIMTGAQSKSLSRFLSNHLGARVLPHHVFVKWFGKVFAIRHDGGVI